MIVMWIKVYICGPKVCDIVTLTIFDTNSEIHNLLNLFYTLTTLSSTYTWPENRDYFIINRPEYKSLENNLNNYMLF